MPSRDAISVLSKDWQVVVGVAIACGMVALTLCLLQKPVYEATTTLYVTSGTNQAAASSYDSVMGSQNRVNSYSRLVYSDAVLVPAVKAAGLNLTPDQARNAVRAQTTPETVLLTIGARDENPEVARRLANAVGDALIAQVGTLEVPNGGGEATSRLTALNQAVVGRSPVSPATLVNVVLAVTLGLFAGAAGVLARERLNDTVRDAHDVEQVLNARPLASIPRTKNLCASALADRTTRPNSPPPAFRHLRNAWSAARSDRLFNTILVTSPRESEGKSTVAVNLGAALSEGGRSAVVVDADLDPQAAANRPQGDEGPGLADVIRGHVPVTVAVQQATFDGLRMMSAGHTINNDQADLLASRECGRVFSELAESFDHVIVDGSAFLDGPEAEAAARWADGVLLVARAGRTKISDLRHSLTQLSDARIAVLGVVLNDVRGSGRGSRHSARRRHAAPQQPTGVIG